jgi:hypothetical protein
MRVAESPPLLQQRNAAIEIGDCRHLSRKHTLGR